MIISPCLPPRRLLLSPLSFCGACLEQGKITDGAACPGSCRFIRQVPPLLYPWLAVSCRIITCAAGASSVDVILLPTAPKGILTKYALQYSVLLVVMLRCLRQELSEAAYRSTHCPLNFTA